MTQTAPSLENLSFEAAMTELESIVKDLESGKISLEQSITAYERGMSLKAHCEKKLHDAQMKIEKIVAAPNGTITTEPLDEK
jgi:exodeoxyribonuclease VII small subunit